MSSASIITVGNAIVDIIAHADESFIGNQGMEKGAMNLIDQARAEALYEVLHAAGGAVMEVSGGSAANTAVGVASLGGDAGFIGKIAEDALGRVFERDIKAAGVAFPPVYDAEHPTACSFILVTPDTERTMNTYLGACIGLEADDMDEPLIASADWAYLEGYLFDSPQGPRCYERVAEIARASHTRLAISLSDAWCVERHREALLCFIADYADLVFGNEDEVLTLFAGDANLDSDLDAALRRLPSLVAEAVVTRGAMGSVAVTAREQVRMAADSDVAVVDTTGAGDLYASGYLFGRQQGAGLEESARLATLAASEIISHIGARPRVNLSEKI